jgi:hypothetical protein
MLEGRDWNGSEALRSLRLAMPTPEVERLSLSEERLRDGGTGSSKDGFD